VASRSDIDPIALLDWLGHVLVSIDLRSRRIVYVSPSAASRLGGARPELEARTIGDVEAERMLASLIPEPELRARAVAMLSAPIGTEDHFEYLSPDAETMRWRRMSMRVVDAASGPRFDVVTSDVNDLVQAREERATAIAIREMSEAVHSAADLTAAIRSVATHVAAHLRVDRCMVVVFGGKGDPFGGPHVVAGPDGSMREDAASYLDAVVADFGRTAQFDPATFRVPPPAHFHELGVKRVAFAVIGVGKEQLGVLSATSFVPRSFAERDMAFLRDVADRLAGPLAEKRLEDERRRAAATLTETTSRLLSALDSGGIGIWEWNADAGVTTCDATSLAHWELDATANVSEEVRKRVHPDDHVLLERARAEAARPGGDGAYRLEYRYAAPSGTKHLMVRGRFMFDAAGKLERIIGTLQDMTHARRLEAKLVAAQKLESLGVLAGGIAHDFNNLLVGILGNAGLAKLELPPNATVLGSIEGIETAALRASELTRQLLAYAGKARFVISTIALDELVKEMGHLLNAVIGKGVVLRYQFGHGVPPVRGDATQLRQVVMNLITNASDAIGDRSGIITVATSLVNADRAYLDSATFDEALTPGDYVCLQVSDTGVGMTAETQSRIFEPFFTTKFTGRGLGLAAVQGILRAHRGALKVYSEQGRGTTFRILLPAGEGQPDESGRAPTPTPTTASGRILVIDDEETMRNVTRRILATAGFTVLTAIDGVEGVELFRAHPGEIDLVILDVTMPRMGGEETFRQLRAIDPNVRVLLASGYSEQEATAQFAGKGLAGFVEKPFQMGSLLEKVRAALRT
jgi:signal transduction histidine kinase